MGFTQLGLLSLHEQREMSRTHERERARQWARGVEGRIIGVRRPSQCCEASGSGDGA